MGLEEEYKTIKEQVRWLLEHHPRTRENDFYLALLWLKYFGGVPELPYIDWEKIKAISGKIETVSRARRKWQEYGLYLPSDPAIKARRERQRKFARIMRTE